MNRRNFLSLAALAIAGKAAERVFPFRVYSIPKEIVVATQPLNSLFDIKYSHYNAGSGTYMGLSRSVVSGTPALFGGNVTSVDEELIQQYADLHMTAAMREFKERLRGLQYYQGVPRLEWNGISREWVPTAPQSSRP